MKKIILVGASSGVSQHLYKTKKNKYKFIRMSRDPNHSDVEGFDLLNEETYFKTEEKINAYKMYLILFEFIYKKTENPKILDVDICIIKGRNDLTATIFPVSE